VSASRLNGKVPVSGNPRKLLSLPIAAAITAALLFTAGPALAASATSTAKAAPAAPSAALTPGERALLWARTQLGKPYEFGATGPGGYDCSGLVMEAYRHIGIKLPRTTYAMLSSSLLVRVSHPAKGDLAFYGSGHVELYAHGDFTYGAHDSGTRVGWIAFSQWWHPTAYYRVR
jgi:cell wall-associated NlpC family hydrolase